jgi:hypothetical protein
MTNPGGTIATEAGHWYTQTGAPCHEVPNKSKPGEMRPTTKGDARKLNLSPSVSLISNLLAKEGVEKWKRDHLMASAVEVIRNPLEGDQAYMDRVWECYTERTTRARELGTLIHGEIEKNLGGGFCDEAYERHVSAALAAVDDWCGLEGLAVEKSFSHPLGYGGRVDVHKRELLDSTGWVLDFKTTEFAETKLPRTYDNHAIQLAAYREGLGMSSARCAIIYVSTSVPGLTHLVELSQDELERGWDIFERLVELWQIVNNYKPQTELTKEEVFA